MMLRKIFPMLVILVLPVLAKHPSSLLAQTAPMPAAMPTAATSGLAVGVPKLPPIATPRNQQVIPVPEQPAPDLNMPSSQTAPFEHGASVLSLPGTFVRQISPTERVAPESIISQSYLGTRDDTVRGLSLKEAIYIGLANNPNVKVAELDPLASEEAVEVANGAFDPALTAEGDIIKSVVPVTSPFQVTGSRAFTNKLYDWDFGLNKVSALTNGTIGLTFNNERAYSNSSFASINPSLRSATRARRYRSPCCATSAGTSPRSTCGSPSPRRSSRSGTWSRVSRTSCCESALTIGTWCRRRRTCRWPSTRSG